MWSVLLDAPLTTDLDAQQNDDRIQRVWAEGARQKDADLVAGPLVILAWSPNSLNLLLPPAAPARGRRSRPHPGTADAHEEFMAQSAAPKEQIVASNRRAHHLYKVLERIEAGLVLQGTEVKAIREGRVQLREAYAAVREGEVFLYDCHVGAYSHTGYAGHDPMRPRKLLLNKREIKRLVGKLTLKGLTVVPLRLYIKRGRVKVELALAEGKKLHDRRETERRKDAEREMAGALRRRG
jgi:SsrA-binding protein